ncbi:hypothetical protein [Sodalis sp. dw_96]|uniref:hypothetical protein n=1 Tax=Sodalis sp. dw_96 TaxID=2719794 RepID=UPI001BD5CDC4|nr:hypothetical protein [Sodalis sp. dw_96]
MRHQQREYHPKRFARKKTLQLLKLSINGGRPQNSTFEPIEADETIIVFNTLSAEKKELHFHDLYTFYIFFFLESNADMGSLKFELSNNRVLSVANIGDNLVLSMAGIKDTLVKIKTKEIPDMLERFILKYNDFFKKSDVYTVVMKFDTAKKHREFDILTNAHPLLKQPCFLLAEYVKSKSTEPQKFRSPALDDLSKTGLPLDIGCFFCGDKNNEAYLSLGDDIKVEEYISRSNKISLKIRAQKQLLNTYADDILKIIKNAFPMGCILKLGDGEGDHGYYDVQKDILFYGGTAAYVDNMSGMGLKDFFAQKSNSGNAGRKETLMLTDHSALELLQESTLVAGELGMKYERFT